MALTKAEMLAEAIAARHALITGENMTSVRKTDFGATYQQMDREELEAYIQQLTAEAAAEAGSTERRRAPIRFWL